MGRGNWGKAWSGLGQSAESKADDSSKRPRTMIDGSDAWKATPHQESSTDVGGDWRRDYVATGSCRKTVALLQKASIAAISTIIALYTLS